MIHPIFDSTRTREEPKIFHVHELKSTNFASDVLEQLSLAPINSTLVPPARAPASDTTRGWEMKTASRPRWSWSAGWQPESGPGDHALRPTPGRFPRLGRPRTPSRPGRCQFRPRSSTIPVQPAAARPPRTATSPTPPPGQRHR